jgi:cold shock protein
MTPGVVKSFHHRKGWGFLTLAGESRDVFVYWTAIEGQSRDLAVGELVQVDVIDRSDGRLRARRVVRSSK